MIFGGTAGRGGAADRSGGEPDGPTGGALPPGAVTSRAGSTATSAVLLGQGGERPVVCGQFRIVIVVFADGRDRHGHAVERSLPQVGGHLLVAGLLIASLGLVADR